jgi:predicted nucleic acid-binding protein
MAPVLLDTTVLIDILRGREGAIGRLRRLRDQGDTPYVCAINVEEVARGLRRSEEPAAEQLLTALGSAPLGAAEGWVAGEWRRQQAADGRTLAQADCLVAAAAAALGGRLATGNPRDFPFPDLEVDHWPAGE